MNNDHKDGRLNVALMLNVIAPSRLALYSGLAERFNLLVLHGGTENDRELWDDLGTRILNADVRQAWGFQIRKQQKVDGKVFKPQFIHITPGFAWHLLRFWPDAVISQEMGFRTIIALLYGTVARKPVWIWWGGTIHTERKIGKIRRTVRFLISHWGCNWISYGQTSTEYLLTLGVRRQQILEAQNCVDERLFREAREPAFQLQPRPVLLHVGRFIALKGIDLLLRAAALVQHEGPEFSLLLVGSGRDKQELEALARDLQLKNVRFEQGKDPFKMAAVYGSADVLIFPTLEDVWGLVANEAMLCGLPVLCSKYAGCATELLPAESIFDPHDASEFARKLRDAVTGRLPKPDCSRLKTTPEIVHSMTSAVENSIHNYGRPSVMAPVSRGSGC